MGRLRVGIERILLPPGLNATGQSTFYGLDLPRLQCGLALHLIGGFTVGVFASAEISWLEPDAPAWATVGEWPLARFDAGMRAAVTF